MDVKVINEQMAFNSKTTLDILKFIPGSGARGNKTKEIYNSLLSLEMIHLVLFHQALQPSMNFNISELVSVFKQSPQAVYIYLRNLLTKIWRHTVAYFVYEI